MHILAPSSRSDVFVSHWPFPFLVYVSSFSNIMGGWGGEGGEGEGALNNQPPIKPSIGPHLGLPLPPPPPPSPMKTARAFIGLGPLAVASRQHAQRGTQMLTVPPVASPIPSLGPYCHWAQGQRRCTHQKSSSFSWTSPFNLRRFAQIPPHVCTGSDLGWKLLGVSQCPSQHVSLRKLE